MSAFRVVLEIGGVGGGGGLVARCLFPLPALFFGAG